MPASVFIMVLDPDSFSFLSFKKINLRLLFSHFLLLLLLLLHALPTPPPPPTVFFFLFLLSRLASVSGSIFSPMQFVYHLFYLHCLHVHVTNADLTANK
jgi:hypothetical protein